MCVGDYLQHVRCPDCLCLCNIVVTSYPAQHYVTATSYKNAFHDIISTLNIPLNSSQPINEASAQLKQWLFTGRVVCVVASV